MTTAAFHRRTGLVALFVTPRFTSCRIACPSCRVISTDGPLSILWHGRLLHLARKHDVDGTRDGRKRTALFEITGNLESGPLGFHEWSVLPSAGDTAYAGAASLDGERFTLSWYAGDQEVDDKWIFGMLAATPLGNLIQNRFRGPPSMVTFLPSFWLLVPGALGLASVKRLLTDSAGMDGLVTVVFAFTAIALGTLVGESITKPLDGVLARLLPQNDGARSRN